MSETFHRPGWQASAEAPVAAETGFAGRGVPDVGAFADPAAGYAAVAGGERVRGGGTAAAAALWAALVVLIDEHLAKIRPGATAGYFTPLLYCGIGLSDAFNRLGGTRRAGRRWNLDTGWGSPRGLTLLRALARDR